MFNVTSCVVSDCTYRVSQDNLHDFNLVTVRACSRYRWNTQRLKRWVQKFQSGAKVAIYCLFWLLGGIMFISIMKWCGAQAFNIKNKNLLWQCSDSTGVSMGGDYPIELSIHVLQCVLWTAIVSVKKKIPTCLLCVKKYCIDWHFLTSWLNWCCMPTGNLMYSEKLFVL